MNCRAAVAVYDASVGQAAVAVYDASVGQAAVAVYDEGVGQVAVVACIIDAHSHYVVVAWSV